MMLLTANSLASFTTAPLHIATTLGLTMGALCVVGAGVALMGAIFGTTVPGWASITVAILFLSATQLVCLGMLGAYIGRIFEEVQRRPLYVVDRDSAKRAPATWTELGSEGAPPPR